MGAARADLARPSKEQFCGYALSKNAEPLQQRRHSETELKPSTFLFFFFLRVKARTSRQFSLFFGSGQETTSTRLCNKNYLNALFQSFKSIRKLLLNKTMSWSKTASKSDIMADLEACVNPVGPYRATFTQQKRVPVLIAASLLDFVWPIMKA